MLIRNRLKQLYKHRQPRRQQLWKCVLQQNSHMMAVHSINLSTGQLIRVYLIFHLNARWNCSTKQGRGWGFADITCSTTFRSRQEAVQGRQCRKSAGDLRGYLKTSSSNQCLPNHLLSLELCCQNCLYSNKMTVSTLWQEIKQGHVTWWMRWEICFAILNVIRIFMNINTFHKGRAVEEHFHPFKHQALIFVAHSSWKEGK